MVNNFFLELVNSSLIISAMNSYSLHAGRRAQQLVPSLGGRAIAAAQPVTDDIRTFWMTFAGGLVFFATFLG